MRVLIVDDQAPFRAVARAVVGVTAGFVVVGEAASGEASVDAARRLTPDLVLMDVRLPGIDGPEASRRILDLPAAGVPSGGTTRHRPVVLLLSTLDAIDVAPALAASGAAAYVPKAAFGPRCLADAWAAATGTGAGGPRPPGADGVC